MKLWTVMFICAFSAVNATLQSEEIEEDIVEYDTTDESPTVILNAEYCNDATELSDKTVRIVIGLADAIHDCINTITRVLNSNGTVIFAYENRTAAAGSLASATLKRAGLYFNKYYVASKMIRERLEFIFSDRELEIKAFVTLEAIIEQLYTLVHDEQYEQAVDLSKHLYEEYFNSFKGKILHRVYTQLMQEDNGYKLMNFVYILVQNDGKTILDDCFPLAFQWIVNGNTVRLLNREKKGTITLYNGTNFERVYIDCKGSTDSDSHFEFNPYWNMELNKVAFEVKNPEREKIKMNRHTSDCNSFLCVHIVEEEDMKESFQFRWLLKPVLNKNGELAFCISHTVYLQSYLFDSCTSERDYVLGVCTPDMGWIIEPIDGSH